MSGTGVGYHECIDLHIIPNLVEMIAYAINPDVTNKVIKILM